MDKECVRMGRVIAVLVLILALGVAGLYVGRQLGFGGDLGLIAAIAGGVSCLVAAMEERNRHT